MLTELPGLIPRRQRDASNTRSSVTECLTMLLLRYMTTRQREPGLQILEIYLVSSACAVVL